MASLGTAPPAATTRALHVRAWDFLRGNEFPYLAARYAVGGLVFFESLVLAYLLPAAVYGKIAFLNQVVTLLAFLGLGTTTGYVVLTFRREDHPALRHYPAFAAVQYLALVTLLGIVLYLLGLSYWISCLLFLIALPFFVFEPLLRVRRRFVTTSLNKGLVSAFSMLLFAIPFVVAGYVPAEKTALQIFVAANVAAYILYAFLVRDLAPRGGGHMAALVSAEGWKDYFRLVRVGLPLNVTSILYASFLYLDRFFVAEFYPGEALGVYSLAHSLCMITVLGLASLNYVYGVNVGEALSRDRACLHQLLWRQLKTGLGLGMLGGCFVAGLAYVLGRGMYQRYEQLALVVVMVLVAQTAYQAQAAVSSLLVYKNRLGLMNMGFAAMLAVGAVGNTFIARGGWNYLWIIGLASAMFLLSSVVFVVFTFHVARQHIPSQPGPEMMAATS